MNKLALVALLLGFSALSFANSCLLTPPQGDKQSCTEFESDNPAILEQIKQGCMASPHGQWVAECTNAEFGCRSEASPAYTTTIWFVNGETKEAVETACRHMGAEFVTK